MGKANEKKKMGKVKKAKDEKVNGQGGKRGSRHTWTVQWYSPGCVTVHPHVTHASFVPTKYKS